MNLVDPPAAITHLKNGISRPLKNAFQPISKEADVILLSDEDDEIATKRPRDSRLESREDAGRLVRHLEHELRNEESLLTLLQHIRTNQRGPNLKSLQGKPLVTHHYNHHNNNNIITTNCKSLEATIDLSHEADDKPTSVKVTKQIALQAIDQQFASKRANLRKQLEKSLEKVTVPAHNASNSEIAFVPSVFSGDFLTLIGLEEVCRGIRDFDPAMNKPEPRRIFNPFTCARCQTDFTPVWKRDKPGSTGVACEACLAGGRRASAAKEYEASIKEALETHARTEKDVDLEYTTLVNCEDKLQLFMKEHEKKLTEELLLSQRNGTSQKSLAQNGPTVSSLHQQQQLNLAQAQLLAQLQQQQKAVANATNSNQTNAILSAMAATGATNVSQQQQRLNSLMTQLQGQQQSPQDAIQMAQLQQALMNSLIPPTTSATGGSAAQQQQLINSILLQYHLMQRQQTPQQTMQQQLAMAAQHQQQQLLMLQQAAQHQQYANLIQSLYQQQQHKK